MNYKDYFWKLKKDYVYLDNAASTPPLKNVMDKVLEFMEDYSSIHRGAGELSYISTERYENARKIIEKYLKATKDDAIVFTANTTDAINRFALLYPFEKNDKVLVSDIEHSSNLLPWIKTSVVKTFETTDYKIYPENIEKELKEDKNIKIVAISGSSNLTGYVTPIKEIYDICKKYNVYLFIDASQLAPHYPVSLEYCDFIAFSGHKMYAPFGCGILAGKKDVLEYTGLAPTGGGNVVYVSKQNDVIYKEAPFKHESGTPNGVGAIALAEAMRTLNEDIGWNNIIKHNEDILGYALKEFSKLDNINVYFSKEITTNRSPIIAFELKTGLNAKATDLLRKKNIGVRCGTFCLYSLFEKLKNINPVEYKDYIIKNKELPDEYDLIRASCGLMNSEKDIDTIIQVLKTIK